VLENLFPTRIKQLRKEKKPKMTQQRLAIVIGVDVRTIRRWERGDRWPGPGDIQALAQALGVRIRDLFDFPEHPEV
jgi:transcriptional regulator with XRE-family HTH domain